MTAAELEAMAETMERAAKALREEAAEKRKDFTSAQPINIQKPTELDRARAKRKLRERCEMHTKKRRAS